MSDTLLAFDPRVIPARPLVDIRFEIDDDGHESAFVDGLPVALRPGEAPREGAVRLVAGLVDRLAGVGSDGRRARAVRARLGGPDGTSQLVVVHRDRRLFVPSEGTDPAAAPDFSLHVPLASRPTAHNVSSEPLDARVAQATRASSSPAEAGAHRDWSSTFLDDPAPFAPLRRHAGDSLDPCDFRADRCDRPGQDARTASEEFTNRTDLEEPKDPKGPKDSEHLEASGPRAATDGRALAAGAQPRPGGASEVAVPPRRILRVNGAVVAVVVAALVASAALGVVITSFRTLEKPAQQSALEVSRPPGSAADQSLQPVDFPGAPPAGWLGRARWVSPPLDPEAGPAVAVGESLAVVTASRRLRLLDPATGATRWEVELPAGAVTGSVARTRIGDADVVAVQTGSVLSWWSPEDGRPLGRLELPAAARTTYLGAAPLVGLDATTVGIVAGSRLSRITVPGGAFALAATADGRVTAASPTGWWHLRPGSPPGAVTPWEDPEADTSAPAAAPTVVGYLGSSILTLYPAGEDDHGYVVAHADRNDDVRVSFRGRAVPAAGKAQRWWPSPAGTWGVLGRTLVDLRRGSVTDLGEWTTTWLTADRAYGRIDADTVRTGPGVPRGSLPPGQALPETVTPAGAAVRARTAGGEVLYLLPPHQ